MLGPVGLPGRRSNLLYNADMPLEMEAHYVSTSLGRVSRTVQAGMLTIGRIARSYLIAGILAGALFLVACSGGKDAGGTVHGKLTDVQSRTFAEIESFSLRDETGQMWLFSTDGPLEITPSHLRPHMVTGEEVSVQYEHRAGALIAVGISDYP